MIRIVKLTFDPARTEAFQTIFAEKQHAIRHFPGCSHLELWQEKAHPGVFFTCSHWENMDALDAYRHSDLFAETWMAIKGWFAGKPEAWSLEDRTPRPA